MLPLVLVLYTLSLFSLLLGLLNLRIVMSLILTYTNYFKLLKLEGEGGGNSQMVHTVEWTFIILWSNIFGA